MKIRIHVDGQVVTATLYDNATARDFATLLPLSLTLEDYAGIERVADLPRTLSTQDAPDSMTPQAGDIAHYAPWGNLAILWATGPIQKSVATRQDNRRLVCFGATGAIQNTHRAY